MSGTSSPQQRAKLAEEYRAERAKKRDPARTPSRTFGNSTQRETYTGPNIGTSRDGAYDANSISSASFAAQIRRAQA